MLSYVSRSLRRNPRRALAAIAGIVLAFALVADAAFFVGGSARQMTRRAIAHVTIDMQAAINQPLASSLSLVGTVSPRPPVASGQTVVVSYVATNNGPAPANGVMLDAPVPAQLAYQFDSTQRDGASVPDVVTAPEVPEVPEEPTAPTATTSTTTIPRPTPPPASPLHAGFNLGTLAPGASTTVAYQAAAKVPVPSAADLLSATVRSAEEPAPAPANGPKAVDIKAVAAAIRALRELRAADPFGLVELPPGTVTAGGTVLDVPVKLVGLDPGYGDSSIVGLPPSYAPASAFLSPAAAQRLGATPGSTPRLRVRIPGTPESSAIDLPATAVANLSGADPLFASRQEDSLGDFVSAPYVVGVDLDTFQRRVLPALRLDATAAIPAVTQPPVLEVHAQVDRSTLASDPGTARRTTAGIRRSIERTAPGELKVIDNLSVGLDRARKDASLAKVLFMALGFPGALLAGYLAFYGGALLAESERRERALLRARGFTPAALSRAVAYQAAAIAALGSILGAALALGVAGALFPPEVEVGSPALAIGVGVAVAILITVLAIYFPARRALLGDVTSARQAVVATSRPAWLRARLDIWLLLASATISVVFVLTGGFKPKPGAIEESIARSFYILLAPWCLWLGGALLAARLFLATGRKVGARTIDDFRHHLVRKTLMRSITRRPAVVSAGIVTVSLAVAFGVSLAIFVTTFHQQQKADARFVVGSDVRVTLSPGELLPADIEQRLRVPGVVALSPVAEVPDAVLGSDRLAFTAIDPKRFGEVASLSPGFFTDISPTDAMDALATDPNAVLVDRETADSFNLSVGDVLKFQVPSPSLGQPILVTLKVAGTLIQFPGYPTGLDFVGNLGTYQQTTGATTPSYFLLRTDGTEATNARVVETLATALGTAVPARITTTAGVGNRDQTSIAGLSLTGLGRVEGFYTLLIASLGIIIFVAMLLVQRNTERAVMRALGLARRRLRAIVLGEAAIVATASVVVGSVIGVPMAYMFVQILRRIFVVPPKLASPDSLPLLLLGLLALTITIAAAIISVSARRLRLVELLRSE